MSRLLDRFNHRLAEVLVRHRGLWFLLTLGLTSAAAAYLIGFKPLQYNRSMEGFFPKHDPALHTYLKNKEWFGGEATLLVAYRDAELWTTAGMRRQEQLASALRNLQELGVKTVTSLAESPAPGRPWQTIAEVVDQDPASLQRLQELVRESALYQGVLIADDLHTTSLLVQLRKRFETSDDLGRCLEAVRNTAKQILGGNGSASLSAKGRGQAAVVGPAVVGTHLLIHDVYEYTEADGQRLQILSVLFMGIVIAIFFRSLRWIVLPLLVIYAALFWAESLWALWRGELTMVSSAISSLVAVIGVSTVVHYGMHYRELRRHHDSVSALRETLYAMNPPIFWMLMTTAAGFASLLICELKPVHDFAWIMVMATLLAGVATLGFMPFMVLGLRTQDRLEVPGGNLLSRLLDVGLRWVRHRPVSTTTAMLVPALGIASGIFWLKPQTDFTNNFRRDTEVYQAYSFVESQFGGAGQLDVVFSCPDLFNLPEAELQGFVNRLRLLEKELKALRGLDGSELGGVTKVLGLVDFLDFFESSLGSLDRSLAATAKRLFHLRMRLQVLTGDVTEARKALQDAAGLLDGFAGRLLKPEQREAYKKQLAQIEKQLERFAESPPGKHFWNREAGKMRITLQTRERLSGPQKVALIAAAERKAEEVLGPDSQPQATGIYLMLTRLITNLLGDQRMTFALALLFMFGMGLMAFRNFWLAAITMVPTVVPIVAILGTMGWFGLPINIATAMLASVAMGMTIDSSLLYIYRFRQERQSGLDFAAAIERTHASTGLALVVANIALVLGFAVLAWSRFIPLVHFGILTGLALIGGLVGNLLLLPLLLSLAPGIRGPTPTGQGPTAAESATSPAPRPPSAG